MTKKTRDRKMGFFERFMRDYCSSFVTLEKPTDIFFHPGNLAITAALLLIAEFVINVLVVRRVPYTEIDWKAYMQEVEGVLNGTMDYNLLKGDTGPLVYPAGFVYIFSALYMITEKGTNIRMAQYIYVALYLLTMYIVFHLYLRTKKIPPYVLVLMSATSYRIHSIFVLRLFNDPIAMLIAYLSFGCFINRRFTVGCILYSLAVSVKMNILLFAPALFMVLWSCLGIYKTIVNIGICGIIQVALAIPFLVGNPRSYIVNAFNLGRIFEYRWTVNWRCIPEGLFLDRRFHLGLLGLHILCLTAFALRWKRFTTAKQVLLKTGKAIAVFPDQILLPLFTCNFIGMAFSRSLHYQFYIWYYHSLPYLLWSLPLNDVSRLALWGSIELCWNTYPSTEWSSTLLHSCHAIILYNLVRHWPRDPYVYRGKTVSTKSS